MNMAARQSPYVRVRQFQGTKYLSTTTETKIERVPLSDAPKVDQAKVEKAKELLELTTVECRDILSVDIVTFYTCVSCGKRVQARHDSNVLKCTHCRNYQMAKASQKTTAARIKVQTSNGDEWYTLFTSCLQAIVDNYKAHLPQRDVPIAPSLQEMDEDKRSEIVLLSNNLKLKVRNEPVVSLEFS